MVLGGIIALRPEYNWLTSLVDLPETFEHTLYRTVIAFLLIECVKQLIFLTYRSNNPMRKRDNFIIGINHLSKILVGFLAGALILSLLNISVKEAFTTLSLIAAAVVLMTKDYISNLINGMYLTFARVVNVGDQVSIDGNKGKILDITLTNVHMLNDDDDIVYIPNNKVFSSEIINYTRRELKKSSIEFEVDPLMVTDIEAFENKLIAALEPFKNEIQADTYTLKTVSVKKDSLLLKFQFVLNEPLNKEMDKKVRKFFIRQLVLILGSGQTI